MTISIFKINRSKNWSLRAIGSRIIEQRLCVDFFQKKRGPKERNLEDFEKGI